MSDTGIDPFEDEYESLPGTADMSTHMMAGAMAGMAEHCVMYPVDSVKTRMQSICRPAHYKNIVDAFVRITREEGLFRPVRGINAVAIGAGPAHAMYFACYEKMKRIFTGGHAFGNHPVAYGAAGFAATIVHDAVMNPAEVVKQRMQMYNSPFKSCTDCATTVFKTEGMRAFYRSYTTQLTMNVPFQCIHFVMYETSQEFLNPRREYNPKTHVLSGAFAGAFAAACTTPLDVCKTLLNTQEQCRISRHHSIEGLSEAAKAIYRFQGLSGYFKGLNARIIYQMPSTALAWSVYEFFKNFIAVHHSDDVLGAVNAEEVLRTKTPHMSVLTPSVTVMAASDNVTAGSHSDGGLRT